MKLAGVLGIAAVTVIFALLISLAIPFKTWRTGDQGLSPLVYAPSPAGSDAPRRLWIDTDAACGHSNKTDPDDCLAIALLAHTNDFQIVGISTVFGNAPLGVVDRTTTELSARLSAEVGRPLSVYSGSAAPLAQGVAPKSPAHMALIAALEQGPLTVVALGPLTNLAAVLSDRPDLQSQVARLVAVMGRRAGHIFHPAEGASTSILLGHGPVFRDFNFVMDLRAASQIVTLNLPISLIPYDAARGIEITTNDLDHIAESGGAASWVAGRARPWQNYWQEDIGRHGFYPFDLLAAAYVVEPLLFQCAAVQVLIGKDPTLFAQYWQPTALLVSRDDGGLQKPQAVGSALYCAKVAESLKPKLMDRFVASRNEAAQRASSSAAMNR